MISKQFVSWAKVDHIIDIMIHGTGINSSIPNLSRITCVHGLERGGLIPAVIVSHKLNIPYTSYPELFKPSEVLIVDDICDSGKTLSRWINDGFTTAVLHHKSHIACCTPSLSGVITNSNDWIVYPWEANDSKTIQDYLLDK